ncbi:MAG: helix-turn-helix transcriptional regulator [Bacillota bacterium]
MSTIGERLRQIRSELGLTQTQLAQKVGIRPQHINGIERGAKIPSDQLVKNISRELGIREEWLRHGATPVFIPVEEELLKLMARHGRRAILEQCIRLAREEGDIYLQNQLKESLDSLSLSALYRMVQYLIETYTHSDQKMRNWMEVQFERAFPEFRDVPQKINYTFTPHEK